MLSPNQLSAPESPLSGSTLNETLPTLNQTLPTVTNENVSDAALDTLKEKIDTAIGIK